ncbi:MAG: leucine-rich repeat domain-containing protein [Verrucomicrobiales bacterium]|nr:leucine-rich repeat domain-containing protein [Verrucomicrobiales bacterium]
MKIMVLLESTRARLTPLLATLALLTLAQAVTAAQFGDYEYQLEDGLAIITGYTGPGGDVVIPAAVDDHPVAGIGHSAFYGNPGLTTVTIPDSVTVIQGGAFRGCASLKSMMVPAGVIEIGSGPFALCKNLAAIEVDPQNPAYVSLEGVLFNQERTTLIQCPGGRAGDYTIPSGVIDVGWHAFAGCTRLTRVTIPDGVTYIGYRAFAECAGLARVEIPISVTNIGASAFVECPALAGAYFHGAPPYVNSYCEGCGPFYGSPAVIIFYRDAGAEWGPFSWERPTAPWTEPPLYSEWLPASGLPGTYPNAAAESDDPDLDRMSNYSEMLAGTDPTDPTSLLVLEPEARPADLADEDQRPLEADERALYFQSVPGKSYAIQWADQLTGPWHVDAVVGATTTQKRVVVPRSAKAFYRVILAQ